MSGAPVAVGDSVLAPDHGNLVPGVVTELSESQALVRLAEPYAEQSGRPDSDVWCELDQVIKVLDDATAQPELPP